MSIPTLTSITPRTGSTGGLTLVDVEGTGFRVRGTPPPSGGPLGAPAPTALVLVGSQPATDVRVTSETTMTFVSPPHEGGLVDVVLRNLDDAGRPIIGEEATLRGGFTYLAPELVTESDLARLVRTLLRELKRQVLSNVVLTVHTDFDPETGDELHLAEIAHLPALVLVGPELVENRFFSLNQLPEHAADGGTFVRQRVPYTVDLGFTLVGVSDHTTQLLNLLAATQLFIHLNSYLEMDRVPGTPAAGRVRYEMDVPADGDLRVTTQPNESNLRTFSGRIVIRGFDLEAPATERGFIADGATLLLSEQLEPEIAIGPRPTAGGG